MRSPATWVVVGALLVIALVAAVDGLRGEPPISSPSRETPTQRSPEGVRGPPPIDDRSAVAGELAVARIGGTLYVTDRDCRLWALDLPTLTWRAERSAPAPNCRFALSPTDRRALFGDADWAPSGDLGAVERDGRTEVSSVASGWSFEFEGSEPAFRPDGTLTFVRDGELWGWVEGRCPPGAATVVFRSFGTEGAEERCARVLLSRTKLRRAFRQGVAAVRDPSLSEAVWLDARTAVVHVQGRVAGDGIAVLVDGEVRARQAVFGGQVSDLEASPLGTRVALRFGDTVFVFDRRLQDAGTRPGAGGGQAIAWPPNQRFTLVATDSSVYVMRPGEPMIQIPVAVSDIAWAD
jgi:hypothetical protein